MNHASFEKDRLARDFIDRSGIDVAADLCSNTHWTVKLAELDEAGSTEEHMAGAGADYFFTKVDYCDRDEVRASRMTAEILPGNRTEIAYWAKAAPTKKLKVHRGKGDLLIANPKSGETISVPYDAEDLSEVTLLPGVFYTLRADPESVESLFISGFYDKPVNWDELEIVVQPGDQTIETPDGTIQVPEAFQTL
ncbi:hypothetical protein HYS97_03590 [Candidatus Daviesbacteria bacterium]|nr:hypothetical protein [Candidatus Daviesbacteria bacterium]